MQIYMMIVSALAIKLSSIEKNFDSKLRSQFQKYDAKMNAQMHELRSVKQENRALRREQLEQRKSLAVNQPFIH